MRGIIIGLGVIILILGIFKLGQVSGYHKARFSQRFGDNFNRNFIDPRGGGFLKDFSDRKVALEEALKTETNPRKKQQIRKSIDRINFAINPWKSKRDTAENAIKKKLNKPNGQK